VCTRCALLLLLLLLPVCAGAPLPVATVTWGSAANLNCANSVLFTQSCTGACPVGQFGGYTSVCSGVDGTWSAPDGFCQSGPRELRPCRLVAVT
jgi:hypothetical protein